MMKEESEKEAARSTAATPGEVAVNVKSEQPHGYFDMENVKLKPNPYSSAFFPFKLTWEWFTPTVCKGLFKGIKEDDIWDLPKYDKAEKLLTRFESNWSKRMGKSKSALLQSVFITFGGPWLFAGVLMILMVALQMANPFFLRFLLTYLATPQATLIAQNRVWEGYVWACVLLVSQALNVFLNNHYFTIVMLVGLRVRSALTSLIYQKSLRLSNRARNAKTTGEIVNYMSIDTQKIGDVFMYLHMGWSGAIQVVICLIFLFILINWVTVAGLAVMILLVPVQGFLMKMMQSWRMRLLKFTDQRIKLINEVLNGIRIIKFFSWESSYIATITSIRQREVFLNALSAIIRALFAALMLGTPILVSVVTFILYSLVIGPLDATIVFPALTYFNLLRFPLTFTPLVLTMAIEANVSLGRIQDFLLSEEKQSLAPGSDNANPVKVNNCSFEWDEKVDESKKPEPKKGGFGRRKLKKPKQKKGAEAAPEPAVDNTKELFKLKDVTFQVPKGALCMIVGGVGSGKSSLLQAMIGEMRKLQGEVEITGSVAYCSQQAWITNNTLQGNILFGLPYDAEKYDKVIEACALKKDFEILPAGDKTEIGEKGINLSGGQRQRTSIARAVYCDRDIYFLDDILSAVDAHVGRHIFEKCIAGYLNGKTRLFVTHQLQYVKNADYILVVDEGRIKEQGPYSDLMKIENGLLRRLIEEFLAAESNEEKKEEHAEEKKEAKPEEKKEVKKEDKGDGKLMSTEEKAKGSLSLGVIWAYTWKMGGPLVVLLLLALFLLAQAGSVAADWWLAQWTSVTFKNLNNGQYLGIYAGIGAAGVLLIFFRDYLWNIAALSSANRLHASVLGRVMRAPMSFFDTTPIGRILSRFSKDQEQVDTMIIMVLAQFFGSFLQVVATFALIAYSTPWFLIPLAPIIVLYIIILGIFRGTNRDLKRYESISRSPLFAHFSESLNGLATIRAYQSETAFAKSNLFKVDYSMRTSFASIMGQRWMQFRLDLIGSFIIFFAAILVVALKPSGVINTGVAGLSLSYALQVTQFLAWCIRQAAEAEANMNCVERLVYFSKEVPNEKPAIIRNNRPPAEWPAQGEVKFENFTMKYRPELPPVLHSISLKINPGEKVGVVGRTGAGKSSLMLAVYRLVEAHEGSLFIDGIDISKIGLQDLRSKLSIIPQEPTLFSGTVRSNLDPFNEYKDEHLWNVLEQAHLKKAIEGLPKGLNSPVSENGENFSVGQRQLLCLARALTKNSKILILDEATASVDFETDFLIQKTVREAFSSCTRLTIAHRLNTIVDSDKVLVMDKGRVAEFDTPKNLILNEDSIFFGMVKETGPANTKALKKIALGEASIDILAEIATPVIDEHNPRTRNSLKAINHLETSNILVENVGASASIEPVTEHTNPQTILSEEQVVVNSDNTLV